MTTEDVLRVFNDIIEGDTTDPKSAVIPLQKGFVTVHKFAELFKGAPNNPSYIDLSEIDGGKMGYSDFLNDCRQKGILN